MATLCRWFVWLNRCFIELSNENKETAIIESLKCIVSACFISRHRWHIAIQTTIRQSEPHSLQFAVQWFCQTYEMTCPIPQKKLTVSTRNIKSPMGLTQRTAQFACPKKQSKVESGTITFARGHLVLCFDSMLCLICTLTSPFTTFCRQFYEILLYSLCLFRLYKWISGVRDYRLSSITF